MDAVFAEYDLVRSPVAATGPAAHRRPRRPARRRRRPRRPPGPARAARARAARRHAADRRARDGRARAGRRAMTSHCRHAPPPRPGPAGRLRRSRAGEDEVAVLGGDGPGPVRPAGRHGRAAARTGPRSASRRARRTGASTASTSTPPSASRHDANATRCRRPGDPLHRHLPGVALRPPVPRLRAAVPAGHARRASSAAGSAAEAREIAYADVRAAWRDVPAPLQPRPRRRPDRPLAGHRDAAPAGRRGDRRPAGGAPPARLRAAARRQRPRQARQRPRRGLRPRPAVHARRQAGCVIAYSTFLDDPPADAVFGRAAGAGRAHRRVRSAATSRSPASTRPRIAREREQRR